MRRFPANRLIVALLAWAWVLAGVTVAWSSESVAEIYKWVDQKGVTHYSSAPPATGKARILDTAATTVSVYQAPAPQDSARVLDAIMRRRVALLESQLQAEHLARLSQQASYQTEGERYDEQCLRERRVDCDRDGLRATPYFYAPAPLFMAGRPFPLSPYAPLAPFTPTRVFGTVVRFPHPAGGATRTGDHRGSSRQF